jgi:hypothetical protein
VLPELLPELLACSDAMPGLVAMLPSDLRYKQLKPATLRSRKKAKGRRLLFGRSGLGEHGGEKLSPSLSEEQLVHE